MILVDNAAYSYAYQPLNGVPIIPYYEGKNDYELPALQKYIEILTFSVDVREKNRNTFKLDKYHQFDDLNTLVETLYSANPSH
jgi:CTD small phosphatase-like protein 2